jgi:indole-3-glycerol phosphate synthase
MGVLDEIIAHKRSELLERRARYPIADLQARSRRRGPAPSLASALRPRPPRRVNLIAEVKRASPSRGLLRADLDPAAQARRYAAAGAAVISVLTDAKYFRGSLDDLVAVRNAVGVPLLRKEFIVEEYQLWESRASGADAVLLIVAALEQETLADLLHAAADIGLGTLVEVHTAEELDRALRLDAPVIGVNNRDLQTLETSLEPSLRLLPLIPPGRVAVSESGLDTAADVERVVAAGAHAILVGEGLVRATDVEAKARELLLTIADPALASMAAGRPAPGPPSSVTRGAPDPRPTGQGPGRGTRASWSG